MKSWIQKLIYCRVGFKKCIFLVLTILFFSVGLGCASTQEIKKTETIVTYPNEAAVNDGEQRTTTTVSTSAVAKNKEVVEKTSELKAEHPGIISSTFHAIGYVIALPFIIIGGVLRMIFGG